MPNYYPININLEKTACLIVGGGKVAERKAATLLSCGALVTVISPDITKRLKEMVHCGEITYKSRCYETGDCQGMRLVIGATDSYAINQKVAEDAMAANCLVNVVDQPELSNFIVPATLKRGDLQICVSTNGKSPALARRIRERLELEFGPEYATFLKIAEQVRQKALTSVHDPEKRREISFRLVDSNILQLIREGNTLELQRQLEAFSIECPMF